MASAPQPAEIFHPCRAGHVPRDDGQLREGVAQHSHRVAHALAVAVRGRDGHDVHAPFHQASDVGEDALAIEFAERVARGRDRRAADERNRASRAGLNCALRSCVIRSTSLIVNRPCRWSWSSTTSSLWMPGCSVKNLSARAIGSLPSSFLLMVWTWARGVRASAIFRLA